MKEKKKQMGKGRENKCGGSKRVRTRNRGPKKGSLCDGGR